MWCARAQPLLAVAALVAGLCASAGGHHSKDVAAFTLTDEEYYAMPKMFVLDEYHGCLARGEAYCVGSFELGPAEPQAEPLFKRMQDYSANWVFHFNHSVVHRGLCLHRSCAALQPPPPPPPLHLQEWFSWCVNASMTAQYGMWARPLRLEYCSAGPAAAAPAPLTAAEQGFAALLAVLVACAALATALDLTLPDHTKKGVSWALSFSVRGSWHALQAPVRASGRDHTDLRPLDGLRVMCMMFVIIEHVCWLTTQAYIDNLRQYELMRHDSDVILVANSTLSVQIFFLMSSFLLAHKLLEQRRRNQRTPLVSTFLDTMWNRIIRVSPSYWVVVWFAASWWGRLGSGPLWGPLVGSEVAVCQRKWWTHLLYLNNVIDSDDKCLIQTWYLAADMQLYAVSLLLTLLLLRCGRGALLVLSALTAGTIALIAALAYTWHLYPTYAMHNPELVRAIYSGESSFNVLYQSPLSNAPGALAGLLLAFTHHTLRDQGVSLNNNKVFRWVSVLAPALALVWVMQAPRLLGPGPPARAPAAIMAAIERPIFSFFVALGLLGAMHDVKSPLRSLLSWSGWQAPARLSFGVLLLHMPLNKSLVADRTVPALLTRHEMIIEWFGVALATYACALPLALLVEYPAQRLHRALTAPRPRARAPPAAAPQPSAPGNEKTDAD